MNMPNQKLFCTSVGIALALFSDGLLLISTSGWIAAMKFSFAVLIIPILIGVLLGLIAARKIKFRAVPIYLSLTILLAGGYVGILLPIKIQELRMQQFASDLPVFWESKLVDLQIEVIGKSSLPWVSVTCASNEDLPYLRDSYDTYFLRAGWEGFSRFSHGNSSYHKNMHTIKLKGVDCNPDTGMKNCLKITHWFPTLYYFDNLKSPGKSYPWDR